MNKRLPTKDELEYLYWHEGFSVSDIAKMYNVDDEVIRQLMIKYNIPRRSRLDALRLKLEKKLFKEIIEIKSKKEYDLFLELIDGLLLSDGSIVRITKEKACRFTISQVEDHIDWIAYIKQNIENIGIRCNVIYEKPRPPKFKKGFYKLYTQTHSIFREFRERWYDETEKPSKKIVPEDVRLTPLSMAQWYMGDGSLHVKGKKSVVIEFSTHSFRVKDVETLVNLLNKLYNFDAKIRFLKRRNKEYPLIYIGKYVNVIKFLKLTYPYAVPSFLYKWRLI